MEDKEILSIIITLPGDVKWLDYMSELSRVAAGEVMNFKVPAFPKHVTIGDRCYVVHRGNIKGWMKITGFSEKEFVCSETGKKWTGKFIERSGEFHYLDEEIQHDGFQGFRYFNLDEYKEKLREKMFAEAFNFK